MSNWPNDFDLSKPNWTGQPQRTCRQFRQPEKEPHIIVQGLAVVLVLAFFISLAFVL